MEVKESRNKPLHGWAAFLNLIRLLSTKILLSDPQRPSEPNICLANLLHPSLLHDRPALNYPANPSQLAVSPSHLSVCQSIYTPERRPGYWSWLNEAGSRSLQQIYVLTDSCWRRSLLSDKVLSQSDEVCSDLWGLNVNVNGAAWKFCSECKPKASKRRKIYKNWSRTHCFITTNSGQGMCL